MMTTQRVPKLNLTSDKAHAAGAAGVLVTLIVLQIDPSLVAADDAASAETWLQDFVIALAGGAVTWFAAWLKRARQKPPV